jgi:hypothetical protein
MSRYMRKKIIYIAILAAGLFGSCKKSSTSTDLVNVGAYLEAGTWRVASFVDNGQDETNSFSGYSFRFESNGVVNATGGTQVVTGSWGAGIDDSQSKLFLVFSSNITFQDLTHDWHVLQSTATRVQLEDVSGGGSGTESLVFERN